MPPLTRPLIHFTPPFGWMNDPNGLVFHDGLYHLFYQYHPESLVWGPMHWGHATSRDLLTWEHLPIALFPDDHGTIFSGSAVWDGENTSGLVPGGGFVALFSYSKQTQGLAFSRDGGLTWTKYADNPVLPALAPDYRDPKVFRHGSGWSMVLAAGKTLEFYSSPDLKTWTMTGTFSDPLDVGVWECPDVFPLESSGQTRWVLLVSVTLGAPNGGSGTLYWIGNFDGRAFHATSAPAWFDQGTDNYAGVTWNHAPDGRWLFLAWMNNWSYARDFPAETWRGSMCLPRELSLSDETPPRLIQNPVQELSDWPTSRVAIPQQPVLKTIDFGSVTTPADLKLFLNSSQGQACELMWSSDDSSTVLTWNPEGSLVLDRRSSVPAFHPHYDQPIHLRLSGPLSQLDLRVVIDVASIEIFAEGGRFVLTALVAGLGPSVRFSVACSGPGVTIASEA